MPNEPEQTLVLPPGNGGSRPIPDPTIQTDRAIERLEKSITSYIDSQLAVRDQRIDGIDEATKLRLDSVVAIPKEIDEKVGRLKDVVEERFKSVAQQFNEGDTRSERESRDNKVAVDAAFAAQKEAAAKQDEANAKAIDKSERATAETIKTNQELSRSVTDGLTKDVDSLKLGVSRIESTKLGAVETRSEARQVTSASSSMIFGVVGALVGIGLLLVALSPVLFK